MSKESERLGSLTLAWPKRRKTEFKPVVDLERDGIYKAIPAQDTYYRISVPTTNSEREEERERKREEERDSERK